MNVLYVTKTSLLSDGGGGEERARQVTNGLASRGHDVTILCGKTDQGLQKWMTINGCEIRHVSCIPPQLFRFPKVSFYATRYLFILASLPVLLWLLLRRDVDVIIENMTPYPSLSILVAKLTGTSIVALQHEFYDCSCYRTYDPVTATLQLLVQNILRIGNYNAVIAPTTHVARELADYGVNSSKIVVVPNGVNADEYHLTDVTSDPYSLIMVGRLSKRKGQDTILKAFQTVHNQVSETHLHILGKGPARKELEKLTESLEIEEAVTFHGYVDSKRKIELMNEAGLFVFASKQEGFGLVLLEAMAAGLPIVARKLPVYDDFFEDGTNGRLVKSQSSITFSEAILEMLDERDQLLRMSSVNRGRVSDFTWDSTIEETEIVLEQTIETNQMV